MVRKKLLAMVALLIATANPVSAQERRLDWQSFADAVKRECAKFGATVEEPEDNLFLPSAKRLPPRYPDSEEQLPYVCVWLSFDVTEKGRTENIKTIFKSPSDIGPGFERAAIRSVKGWRYEPANGDSFSGVSGRTAEITFEVPE
ncbi:MAG: energy transducer TonB [Pseudomonadota bacterium]